MSVSYAQLMHAVTDTIYYNIMHLEGRGFIWISHSVLVII